jgi:hypothetical protein
LLWVAGLNVLKPDFPFCSLGLNGSAAVFGNVIATDYEWFSSPKNHLLELPDYPFISKEKSASLPVAFLF